MTDDAAPDHAARYVALQARAREVNHHLRVTIIAGPENPSEEVVMVPLIPQPGDLPAALDAIEGYLDGPDAKRRGELYADRDAKAAAYLASLSATAVARAEWNTAREAVDKDTDRARFPDDQDDDDMVDVEVTMKDGEITDVREVEAPEE